MIDPILSFLQTGGAAMWAIAALSVATLSLILWKLWRLALMGAFAGARAERSVALWQQGARAAAAEAVSGRVGLRARLVRAAIGALSLGLPEAKAREETTRVARRLLVELRSGLRALELIAVIAPLLGLLGTVLGMIDAFQALQSAGAAADPADLAGGIWEALLTTAAGMAVAIPAAVALSWFESVADSARADMEDLATRLFLATEAG
ncbi:MotA/TolQ/ExbB proton channel family protein [Rhodovulum sulfidophilum]|uniref:MotA/TolQ/ExbB proton channel family protein n=1 Tax=Rhodovulum sulfidophilum TaxID=35806 RepID=A0ABS1RVX1_RHOSU|nr:MotA/TolQ/ExbB proton channel family protein [Rhodovulum sulfidophilum]MBL3610232.1 MotA/TolQ/ExbB proton channel family protein [Rhodovulum sulfidophilum]MCE8458546.1 MotA/TolQ/ExbB proton channel family protein [Rhodovulum sulfidophilum]